MDVKTQVLSRWVDALRDLEDQYGLDIENESHVWLAQELFLPMINTDLRTFRSAWNNHAIRRPGQGHRSPAELFVLGMYERGIRGYQLPQESAQAPPHRASSIGSSRGAPPEHLNGVEVNAPELTEEREFLAHQISRELRNGRARPIHQTWTEALVGSRTVFPALF